MPLTPEAQALIAKAKAAKPDEYGPLTDMQVLSRIVEKRQAHPGFDRDKTLQQWGVDWLAAQGGKGIGGFAAGPISAGGSFVKGFADAWNPTPWRMPEAIGDSPGARGLGNIAGNITQFMNIPKLAQKLVTGGAARIADIGARGFLGGMQGFRDADEEAERSGKPLDTEAAILRSLGGAAMGGAPIGWSSKGSRDALATAGTILGGAGVTGASSAMQHDQNALGGAMDFATNPFVLGLALTGGAISAARPAGFRMSALDPEAAVPPPVVPPAQSTALGASPTTGNIPPRQVGPTPQQISATAVEKALSLEGLRGLEGISSSPIDRDVLATQNEFIRMLDGLLKARNAIRGVDVKGQAYPGALYVEPLEGLFDAPTRIEGQTQWDYKIGGKLIPRRDLDDRAQFYLVDDQQRKLLLPKGAGPMSGSRIYSDTLPEDVAAQMGIGREVGVYGRTTPLGEEAFDGDYFVYDLANPNPTSVYPLPLDVLPRTKEFMEEAKRLRDLENEQRGNQQIAGRLAASQPLEYQNADPLELAKVIIEDLRRRFPDAFPQQ